MVGIVNKVYCENMIGCMCYYFPKQRNSLWFIAGLPKQHIGLYVVTRLCYLQKSCLSVKKHTSSSLESFPKTASFFMGLLPDFLLGIMSPYLEVKVK